MTARRFHRTMEVIPRRPWKSKSPFASRPIKTSINKGTRGVRVRYDTVLPPSMLSDPTEIPPPHREIGVAIPWDTKQSCQPPKNALTLFRNVRTNFCLLLLILVGGFLSWGFFRGPRKGGVDQLSLDLRSWGVLIF